MGNIEKGNGWTLFGDFPREIGTPSRVGLVNNMVELLEKANRYNTFSTFFTSLYAFDETNKEKTRGVYGSARIKQIYFETDNPKGLDIINQLQDYCIRKEYMHTIFYSGRRGFHFYIATLFPNNLKNKKGAVTNSQMQIADDLDLKIGINEDSDLDGHVIGNLAQLVRVPNTFHLKGERFCIPLKTEDLDLSIEEIKDKARHQRFGIFVYGKKFLDLSPFDCEPQTKGYDLQITVENQENIGVEKINVSSFPSCIQNIITEKNISHHARYLFILYCRDLGISMGDTILLLKKFLDPVAFQHCIRIEKQPYWVYRREDLVFPNCSTLKNSGLCPSENCKGIGLY